MDNRRRMMLATLGGFPSQEPTAYSLIGTYTSSGEFIAPESGYFQIELFGASGAGGNNYKGSNTASVSNFKYNTPGGGGGGGGYARSRIKLKKGDLVNIADLAVGKTAKVTIYSSIETYSAMKVISGSTGGNASSNYAGTGGAGGVASGGNHYNANGIAGGNGDKTAKLVTTEGGYNYYDNTPGAGGAAGYEGGNTGGRGGYFRLLIANTSSNSREGWYNRAAEAGKAGFVKIYRGNTN